MQGAREYCVYGAELNEGGVGGRGFSSLEVGAAVVVVVVVALATMVCGRPLAVTPAAKPTRETASRGRARRRRRRSRWGGWSCLEY